MTRDLDPQVIAEIDGKIVRPIFMADFIFDEGTLNFWTGGSQLTWNSTVYTGSGNLLKVAPAEETKEVEARNAAFELSGAPSSIISAALNNDYQGRPVILRLAFLDSDYQIVDDPIIAFSGKMDVFSFEVDPDNPIISLTAETDLVTLRRVKERRYTPEDLKLDFPGDKGLDFVVGLQDKEVIWGQG